MIPCQASNESCESGKSNNNECPIVPNKRIVIGGGENSYFMPYKRLAGIVGRSSPVHEEDVLKLSGGGDWHPDRARGIHPQ